MNNFYRTLSSVFFMSLFFSVLLFMFHHPKALDDDTRSQHTILFREQRSIVNGQRRGWEQNRDALSIVGVAFDHVSHSARRTTNIAMLSSPPPIGIHGTSPVVDDFVVYRWNIA